MMPQVKTNIAALDSKSVGYSDETAEAASNVMNMAATTLVNSFPVGPTRHASLKKNAVGTSTKHIPTNATTTNPRETLKPVLDMLLLGSCADNWHGVSSCGLTFELTPTAEAGGVSRAGDDSTTGAGPAYDACRSRSGVERGVRRHSAQRLCSRVRARRFSHCVPLSSAEASHRTRLGFGCLYLSVSGLGRGYE